MTDSIRKHHILEYHPYEYHFTYISGTSGKIIQKLLALYVVPDPENYKIKFSKHGNAHDSYPWRLTGITYDHQPFGIDEVSTNPRKKNIIITITPEMRVRRSANILMKQWIDMYKYEHPYWNQMLDEIPEIGNVDNKQNLTIPQLNSLILYTISHNDYISRMFPYYNYTMDSIPDKYKDRVLILKFRDIIYDSNKVLDQLSEFIGIPTPPVVYETMAAYLTKQEEIDGRFPWLKVIEEIY